MLVKKQQSANGFSAILLNWMGTALVTIVWISSGLFGLYILAFYAAAAYQGKMNRWNEVLPDLYGPSSGMANAGIGLHFAAGGIILILGSIQLIDAIRNRFPVFHRNEPAKATSGDLLLETILVILQAGSAGKSLDT